MKITGLKQFAHNFSVTYETTDVREIVNNQRHLMKINCINIV